MALHWQNHKQLPT